MSSVNNLFSFIFALFPIILYVYTAYYLIPHQYISIHRSRRYLVSGLMSPFLIFLVYFIFPWWGNSVKGPEIVQYLSYGIVQIGLLEEFSKYCVYQWVTSERKTARHDLPVATMFYCVMVSLGFALTENLSYIISFYKLNVENPVLTSNDLKNSMVYLIASRSLTAVVMHIVCGIIIGYFISKSKHEKIILSWGGFDYYSKDLKFPKATHLGMGIFFASLYHGIYDVNLMLPNHNYKILTTIIILAIGLIISLLMTKSLVKESRQIRNTKLN